MRVSRAGLLIVLALSVPVLIELRTILGMIGVSVSMGAYVGLVVVVWVVIVVAWSLQPQERSEAP